MSNEKTSIENQKCERERRNRESQETANNLLMFSTVQSTTNYFDNVSSDSNPNSSSSDNSSSFDSPCPSGDCGF
ncbi:MAG: hypothetical protein FD167_1959 [bacterium]|nr:MAG: hypothetical protein FD167_1959 [bacterium]